MPFSALVLFWTPFVHNHPSSSPLFLYSTGMTGNYLLTNPLLRPHDTNNPYNNLLAETIVCNTPSPPAFHSPGARRPSLCFPILSQRWGCVGWKNTGFFTALLTQDCNLLSICHGITVAMWWFCCLLFSYERFVFLNTQICMIFAFVSTSSKSLVHPFNSCFFETRYDWHMLKSDGRLCFLVSRLELFSSQAVIGILSVSYLYFTHPTK